MLLFAYKQMPADVLEPLMKLIDWLLWVVLLVCLAWLIVSAGRLWSQMRSSFGVNDASHGIVMSLIGAIVASSASTIALVLLPT